MSAQQEIKDAQKAWAERHRIEFDERSRGGYVRDCKDNLWGKDLSDRALAGFSQGSGSELKTKMKALHSSSALVANFFDYWTDEDDKTPLLKALGIYASSAASLHYEKQFHTPLSEQGPGNPPNLDLAIELSPHLTIAIESKFTEPFSRSTKDESEFKKAYFPNSGGLWMEKGLPECQVFAEELHRELRQFSFLDVPQLLKHALGLATQLGDKFSLYYLYYDWPGESQEARKRSKKHKEEIERFADRVRDEIRFKALTYQEVYYRLRASEQAEPEYLEYLGNRYFPGQG